MSYCVRRFDPKIEDFSDGRNYFFSKDINFSDEQLLESRYRIAKEFEKDFRLEKGFQVIVDKEKITLVSPARTISFSMKSDSSLDKLENFVERHRL